MNGSLKTSRADQWASKIRAEQGKCVESIIEVGRLLLKAKHDLPHGEWQRLFDEKLLPFTRQTAFRIMAVGEHPILSNVTHVQRLPPSWGTLYELSRVPEPTLKNALNDGVITPDMPRKDVKALLPKQPARPKPERVKTVVIDNETGEVLNDPDDTTPEPFDIERTILRVVGVIREAVMGWPDDVSLEDFALALEHEAQRVRLRMEKSA